MKMDKRNIDRQILWALEAYILDGVNTVGTYLHFNIDTTCINAQVRDMRQIYKEYCKRNKVFGYREPIQIVI